jgi:hypothetical protein
LGIDPITGDIRGYLERAGNQLVTVTMTHAGGTSPVTFAWEVASKKTPRFTLLNPGNRTAIENDNVKLQIDSALANPPIAKELSYLPPDAFYTAVNLPLGLGIDRSRGEIRGKAERPGDYVVTIVLTYGANTSTVTFAWTVLPKSRGTSASGN